MANNGTKKVPDVQMGPDARMKIKNSSILNNLIAFAQGPEQAGVNYVKLSQTEVHASIALLKKVMPDLSSMDANIEHGVSGDLAELMQRIAQANNRICSDISNGVLLLEDQKCLPNRKW